jgi:asparagine synthase (glutamine-hydrolysing)
MSDNKESIIITFNGEIYNYRELRNTLSQTGYKFKTATDTEVIIAAYKFWGIDFLEKLNGMFAIAIVDMQNKKLFLCRDRVGEKPLYYSRKKNNVYFSSELKSLLECKELDLRLSSKAVKTYFSIGYLPGSMSIVDGISKVLPGGYIEYDLNNSQLSTNVYWKLKDTFYEVEPEYDLFEEIMKSSVKSQLHADVPVGLLLSGGVDSTIVCYMAALLNKNIQTFTFTNKDSPGIDESKYASEIASYLGTTHNTIDSRDMSDINLIDIISLIDEPFSDSSFIPTYLLTKEIKKYCTVAIGGDGAD